MNNKNIILSVGILATLFVATFANPVIAATPIWVVGPATQVINCQRPDASRVTLVQVAVSNNTSDKRLIEVSSVSNTSNAASREANVSLVMAALLSGKQLSLVYMTYNNNVRLSYANNMTCGQSVFGSVLASPGTSNSQIAIVQ
jgi:hypothetical protein